MVYGKEYKPLSEHELLRAKDVEKNYISLERCRTYSNFKYVCYILLGDFHMLKIMGIGNEKDCKIVVKNLV